MNESVEDKLLEDYLHRKSALSMGYRRVYIEAPPPELDRSVTARARRALRWLVPGLLAALIAVGFTVAINIGVNRYMGAMVGAEKNLQRMNEERRAKEEQERLKGPVTVIIDPNALVKQPAPALSREAWLAKIESLKRAGRTAEAEAERKKFLQAYPAQKP